MFPQSSALLTDAYQISMLKALIDHDMNEKAVFELFVRRMPESRNFLISAGLEQAIDFLEDFHFANEDLEWLTASGMYAKDFVSHLAEIRFTGDVYAMPEGTVFFPEEPILRVVAPLCEAQVVEPRLINILQFQTMIASKAARIRLAAPDRSLVDFGLRRAHGADAGLFAARASYLGGLSGTATVLAGKLWDIPLFGTMAHSYVQVHAKELDAFEHFARSLPAQCTWLIDTYDTEAAANDLIPLALKMKSEGIFIKGVRIDSGDLAEHALRVRQILNQAGLIDLQIFASGDLDEYKVRELRSHAPIDGFGIGTRLSTSADAPYLDCVYKLQEYAGKPKRKRSEGKSTWPGPKQVYRHREAEGHLKEDVIATVEEYRAGQPLLIQVLAQGKRLTLKPELAEIRAYAAAQVDALSAPLRELDPAPAYPVRISDSLRMLAETLDGKGQSSE